MIRGLLPILGWVKWSELYMWSDFPLLSELCSDISAQLLQMSFCDFQIL